MSAIGGWRVKVSQQVLEWQNEAALKMQRANLLRALEKRCKAAVPGDVADLIENTSDMDRLTRWFDAALDASTYDDFRKAIQVRL
jgi:hypothetical protein